MLWRAVVALVGVSSVCLCGAEPQDRGIATVSVSPQESSPQKYAVIIGINQYQDKGLSSLKFAAVDARAFYTILKDAPDGVDPRRMILLADGEDPDRMPTRGVIFRHLKNYAALAGPEDTLVFYFAGHGTTIDDKLYLLPADASLSVLKETGLAFSDVESVLKGSAAKRKVLLLDACHSGAGRGTETLSRGAFQQLEQASEGSVVLASCDSNELSYEMENEGHGAFTYFLLQGLAGKADANNDSLISASELSTFTWDNTRLWAAAHGFKQNPWRMERVSGDIILLKVGAPIPDSSPTVTAQNTVSPKPAETKEYASGRFVDNGDGSVLDKSTGLVWEKGDSKRGFAPEDIQRYLDEFDARKMGGATGWRIPTLKEFGSLDLKDFRSIKLPFDATPGAEYWYSTKGRNLSAVWPYIWSSAKSRVFGAPGNYQIKAVAGPIVK